MSHACTHVRARMHGCNSNRRYHAECFSGFADPRSQSSSSMHTGNLAHTQYEAVCACLRLVHDGCLCMCTCIHT